MTAGMSGQSRCARKTSVFVEISRFWVLSHGSHHFSAGIRQFAVGLERMDDLLRFRVVHARIVMPWGRRWRANPVCRTRKSGERARAIPVVNFGLPTPYQNQFAKVSQYGGMVLYEDGQVGCTHVVSREGQTLSRNASAHKVA